MENKDNNKLSCTFCGKGQEEVRKLIAGPSVYICDECVDLCNDIIEEEVKAEDEEVLDLLPSPLEIFRAFNATSRASVPLPNATAYFVLDQDANSVSNLRHSSPVQ